RFNQTSRFQRDDYMVTLVLSALSVAFLIAPVAMHRILFRIRVKDEVVALTSAMAVAGIAVLALSMTAALVLIADWISGSVAAIVCGGGALAVFGLLWFAFPLWLRRGALVREPD